MKRAALIAIPLGALVLVAAGTWAGRDADDQAWTDEERRVLATLSLAQLPPPPPSPGNAHADDLEAARLGRALFHDAALSASGTVSCATCHAPDRKFTDGRALSRGEGDTARHAPSIVGAAWSPWQFWDGRRDSLWSQALTPLESSAEHGISRTAVAHALQHRHRAEYERAFGPLPSLLDASRFPQHAGPFGTDAERAAWQAMTPADRAVIDEIFSNAGKAIEAWERTLRPLPAKLDRHVEAVLATGRSDVLSDDEDAGLKLFIGPAGCIQCHSGPLLTNHEFQGIGLPPRADAPLDPGRRDGVVALLTDPFNCLGEHSDARPDECEELRYVKTTGDELLGAMKVPSLRNVADTAPYMHDGRMPDLRSVLRHYDEAPEPVAGHSDLEPLALSPRDVERLEAFLATLSSDVEDPLAPVAPFRPAAAQPATLGLLPGAAR